MTRFLLVPGRGAASAEHWQQRWAAQDPRYRWAPPPPGPPVVLPQRVAALHRAVTADPEPAVLVAHSAGCLVVAAWAARHTGAVRGALLVTPPYLDPAGQPASAADGDDVVWAVRQRLPFRSILVASRSDPWTTFEQFRGYAEDWGAELFDAGDVGHLDTASGFGPWPDGQRLVGLLG